MIYKNLLDWRKISENENINWSYEILYAFQNQINWEDFTVNSNAFKDKSLLVLFDNKIDWFGVNDIIGCSIVANEGILWDIETIDKYADKIDIQKLSRQTNVSWSETLIDKYIDKWDFVQLAHNESIPWTFELFEKYLDESYFYYFGVQTNYNLISFEVIEKYGHLLDWSKISNNPKLPWIEKDLLNYWSKKIDWSIIAFNSYFYVNDKDFHKTIITKWSNPIRYDKLRWFSYNKHFPWSIEMIEKYKYGIVWRNLCSNEGIIWNSEMIEKYKFRIDWSSLCSNERIIWNSEMIDMFERHVVWGGWQPGMLIDAGGNVLSPVGGKDLEFGLINNKSIPWSIDFLLKYEHKIEFEALENNEAVWDKAFKSYLNDEMIEIIMKNL
jgi:hypothetical protein